MNDGDLARLASAVKAGDRRAIGKAITLVESERAADRAEALALLAELHSTAGRAFRLGVTGAPGVGKSTLVDALGLHAVAEGRRVAVLAVDPSSAKTGGSLLGDRTRMGRLGASPSAFVRPSPSGGAHGGIGRRSREALLVLEAAGYDVLVFETVGVGQGELAVTDCVDVLQVLWLPGAGDDVQGMKRGILEHADLVVFTKADGANVTEARLARDRLDALFHSFRRDRVKVLAVSALSESDPAHLWNETLECYRSLEASGELEQRRRRQRRAWLRSALDDALLARVSANPQSSERRVELEAAVERGEVLPPIAAERLIDAL